MTSATPVRHIFTLMFLLAVLLAGSSAFAADIDGQKTYTAVCGRCHGNPTEGAQGPPLLPLSHTGEEIQDIVRLGTGEMKALATTSITDDELKAVVAYLSSLDKKK